MYKRTFLIAGFTSLFALLLFLCNDIIEKIIAKHEARVKIQSMPSVKLFKMDSTLFQIEGGVPVILVYYDSKCEHCQIELQEIRNHDGSFSNAEVILISSESISAISETSKNYGLVNLPNVHFAKVNSDDLFKAFGLVSVPHIFIYGKDGMLVKEFKGETKVRAILKYI